MATGGGMGRGGRGMALLNALKEKKKEVVKEPEIAPEPVPVPEPIRPQLASPVATPPVAATTSQATPIRFPIGLGRGLLKPSIGKTTEPPKLSQSPPKPSLVVEEQQSTLTPVVETEKAQIEETSKATLSKLLPRGRGIGIIKLPQPKLPEQEPEKSVTFGAPQVKTEVKEAEKKSTLE